MIETIKKYIQQEEVLAKLGIADASDVAVSVLGRGKFNLMHLVEAGGKRFVLRMNTYAPHEKTGKTCMEYEVLKSIEGTGIGPKVFLVDDSRSLFEGSVMVLEYIEGDVLDVEGITDDVLRLVAGKYAELHKITFDKHGGFPPEKDSVFLLGDELEEYYTLHRLRELRKDPDAGPVLHAFDGVLNLVRQKLHERDEKFGKVKRFSLLKGDNKTSNIIVKGEEVRFIDWEFAKVGINIMDLVNFVSFARLDEPQKKVFLDAYAGACGQEVADEDFHVFALRDFVLRTIWTLNKVSEHHKMGNREGFLKSLELLKSKTDRIAKYL
jgi:thiamine kinase-like enzyme